MLWYQTWQWEPYLDPFVDYSSLEPHLAGGFKHFLFSIIYGIMPSN